MFGVDDVGLLGLASAGMSGLSSLYDFGPAAASGLGSSLLGNFFGNRQRSSQGKLAYELAHYQAALNYKYSQMYNEDNYALARRYAENSASWAVQGLRNAGLNPILAAGGGFSGNLGQAGVSSSTNVSTPSLNSNERGMDIAEAMRDFASFRASNASAKAASTQADVNRSTVGLTDANSAKVAAETDAIRTKTDLSILESLLDAQRGGSGSWIGDIRGAISDNNVFGSRDSKLSRSVTAAVNRLSDRLGTTHDPKFMGSSAKSASRPASSMVQGVLDSSPVNHSAKQSATRSRNYSDSIKRFIRKFGENYGRTHRFN